MAQGKMKTIISTYPDFQSLPKGLKQLLVVSESFFFEKSERAAVDARASRWLDAKIAQFPKMADVTPPMCLKS